MLGLFVITLFVSSSLLFVVQPMFGRMVLPLLGGSPAVWNTCMVFFQAALLGGYLYAHVTTRWLGVRRQIVLHACLLGAGAFVLPISIGAGWSPPALANPAWWVLLLLAACVGLPFFVVSASGPLFQRWFSATDHPAARDPYFLYAASNVGSMLALLSYPAVLEPMLDLHDQSRVWTAGYALLGGLTVACATCVWGARQSGSAALDGATPIRLVDGIRAGRLARWLGWSFVPSSLMLAVTTYITTDLVVAPLLWVIPLALYLLTFILVFARRQWVPHRWMVRAMPVAVLVVMLVLISNATHPMPLIVLGHLAAMFVIAMVCHGQLALDRPAAEHLTTFYLVMGVGGLLGGVFNALIAPVLFTTIAEYPASIALACLLAPVWTRHGGGGALRRVDELGVRVGDVLWPAGLAVVMGAMMWLITEMDVAVGQLRLALTAGLPALACYLLSRRPVRFALAVVVVFAIAGMDPAMRGVVLESHRSFFGAHRVTMVGGSDGRRHPQHQLYHGTTLHGRQFIDERTGRPINPDVALAYYHPDGPAGDVFESMTQTRDTLRVGLVGLGVGNLAAYAHGGDRYTYYEIDPIVERLAEDERYFTYLSAARGRGAAVDVVLGDARVSLERRLARGAFEADGAYDLLVLDAFSSDAIPVHLLTREAVEMYLDAVGERGVLAFHISNRYLDLAPVLADVAGAIGLECYVFDDTAVPIAQMVETGRTGSMWAVLVRDPADLPALVDEQRRMSWQRMEPDPDRRVWTDAYSNILGALRDF